MINEVHRLRVAGLGPLRNVSLEPGRLTVLLGARGVGKTSILRAIRLVTHARNSALQRFVETETTATKLIHDGTRATGEISIDVDLRQGDKSNRYSCRLGAANQRQLQFIDESIGFLRMRFSKVQLKSLGSGHFESKLRESAKLGDVTAKVLNYQLSKIAAYQFYSTSQTSTIRHAARTCDDKFLRTNGSNLAPFLARLARESNESERLAWLRINQWFSCVVPEIRQISPVTVQQAPPVVRLDFLKNDNSVVDDPRNIASLLHTAAVVTALAQPPELLSRFICIDDLEMNLSLAGAKALVDLARSIENHAQVLFTTQSSALIDFFAPEEVVVVTCDGHETELERLNATDLAHWIADYNLHHAAVCARNSLEPVEAGESLS